MIKSSATLDVNQPAPTATDNRRAVLKTSSSNTQRKPQHRSVSRVEFIRLLLARHRMKRCDDRAIGIHGLMDPTTGDRFFIAEKDLFEPETPS